jgi:hypothetical protein
MKKTIAILTSSLILSAGLLAESYKITTNTPVELEVADSKPAVLDVNFKVKQAKLIQSDKAMAAIETLEQGVLYIPMKSKAQGIVVITALDGKNYVVNINTGGDKTVFHLEDPTQEFNDDTQAELSFETDRIVTDARNIVKAILLQKPISGFKKISAERLVSSDEIKLSREYRYVGGKYVADYWLIKNITNEVLYFEADEFYTSGVLAVSLQKNRIEPGETMYMISILNKHTVYESEKSES